MAEAIVRKTLDNHDNNIKTGPSNYLSILNKFALKVFNLLSYDRKMNGLFVANHLLNLFDHYFAKVMVKTINIAFL